jgi:hypothetical protein
MERGDRSTVCGFKIAWWHVLATMIICVMGDSLFIFCFTRGPGLHVAAL